MAENIWEIDNQRLLFNHNIVLYDAKFTKECTSRASGAFISLFSAEEASENFYSLGKVSSVSRIMCCYRNNPFFMSVAFGDNISAVKSEALCLLIEKYDGRYLLLLSIFDDKSRGALKFTDDELQIVGYTGCKEINVSTGRLLYIIEGNNPYKMMDIAAEEIREEINSFELRVNKIFPEYFNYLGWCTWNTVVVNEEKFEDIYVGDVWLLAGQSNMQGVGRFRDYDLSYRGEKDIRAFYMDNKWRKAHHPLHAAWLEKGSIHMEDNFESVPEGRYTGVGPGLMFAQCMKEKTGVPQGLICSAYGGAGFVYWAPEVENTNPEMSLYLAMKKRFAANGKHVAGMLWYQGCADAFSCEADKFEERTLAFYKNIRNDFGKFPIVQFQIGRVVHPELPGLVENWMRIREIQRTMNKKAEDLYTLSAINKTLDDLIHLSSESADALGKEAADVMFEALKNKCMLPQLENVCLYNDPKSPQISIVDVRFKNVTGKLMGNGIPAGFYVSENEYELGSDVLFKTEIHGDTVSLSLWGTAEENANKYLYYGFGLNPYCNLTDSAKHGILCFGPLKLSEYAEDNNE